ncbi:Mitochondrial import inner membrane translocase subunit tim23, partial [Geodia barretti]
CTGLTIGGVWGVGEGIQRGAGLSPRLRTTAIFNGLTRRGPFMANNLAVLALLFSPLESALAKGRGVDDSLNTVAAATLTGVLYRSTAGLKSMAIAGGAGCALFGAYTLGRYIMGYSDSLIIFDT